MMASPMLVIALGAIHPAAAPADVLQAERWSLPSRWLARMAAQQAQHGQLLA
jgi:hypothetical protein